MNRRDRHSWIGIILVVIGGLLIIDNFGFFDFGLRYLIFSWHTIALVIGIIILSNSRGSIAGIIFVVIGLWGYANHIFPWFERIGFGDIWPILLIIVGLALLLRKRPSYSEKQKNQEFFQSDFIKSSTEYQSSSDMIDEVSIFTSAKRYINSQNFKGGKVTSIFGGNHLDFARAKLANGENTLEIACIFGGCKIYVPREWKVIVNVTSIFGGIDDKRYANFDYPKSEGVLIIKGAVIFGGCEILSV
jgi:predicted membrane protein